MVDCCYADCHFCQVSIMLCVASKPIMPSVVILNAIMLNVNMLSVMALFHIHFCMQSLGRSSEQTVRSGLPLHRPWNLEP